MSEVEPGDRERLNEADHGEQRADESTTGQERAGAPVVRVRRRARDRGLKRCACHGCSLLYAKGRIGLRLYRGVERALAGSTFGRAERHSSSRRAKRGIWRTVGGRLPT